MSLHQITSKRVLLFSLVSHYIVILNSAQRLSQGGEHEQQEQNFRKIDDGHRGRLGHLRHLYRVAQMRRLLAVFILVAGGAGCTPPGGPISLLKTNDVDALRSFQRDCLVKQGRHMKFSENDAETRLDYWRYEAGCYQSIAFLTGEKDD